MTIISTKYHTKSLTEEDDVDVMWNEFKTDPKYKKRFGVMFPWIVNKVDSYGIDYSDFIDEHRNARELADYLSASFDKISKKHGKPVTPKLIKDKNIRWCVDGFHHC